MKILFDHQTFLLQRYGGISRYFSRLAQELLLLNQKVQVLAPFHQNRHLRELQSCCVGKSFDRLPGRLSGVLGASNVLASTVILPFLRPDVIHETYYSSFTLGSQTLPRVISVFDMIHELFANEFSGQPCVSDRKRISIARADHIISISHSTKRDLCALFDVPENKVTVVHLAYDALRSPALTRDQRHGRPYLLYVGNRGGYKNFLAFLRAVASAPRLKEEFDIIAFGGGSFTVAERTEIARLGFREGSVRQISGGDGVLGDLYSRAAAFVYPSLYEGFGLPPLEAMSHNCPVVSSGTSSMPEVIGDAAEFFDPHSLEDMVLAIEKVVLDSQRAEQLRVLGKLRLSHFSWRKCAEETLSVYRMVC